MLKPAIVEKPFQPEGRSPQRLLAGLDRTPPLFGYVATTPKEVAAGLKRPSSPIRTIRSWRCGTSAWGRRWPSPRMPAISGPPPGWRAGAALRALLGPGRSLDAAALRAGRLRDQRRDPPAQGTLVADVIDFKGNFVNQSDVRGRGLRAPHDEFAVNQVAPGRYEATFDAPEKGSTRSASPIATRTAWSASTPSVPRSRTCRVPRPEAGYAAAGATGASYGRPASTRRSATPRFRRARRRCSGTTAARRRRR